MITLCVLVLVGSREPVHVAVGEKYFIGERPTNFPRVGGAANVSFDAPLRPEDAIALDKASQYGLGLLDDQDEDVVAELEEADAAGLALARKMKMQQGTF